MSEGIISFKKTLEGVFERVNKEIYLNSTPFSHFWDTAPINSKLFLVAQIALINQIFNFELKEIEKLFNEQGKERKYQELEVGERFSLMRVVNFLNKVANNPLLQASQEEDFLIKKESENANL